jgi:intein-encoded DNA endonuclease-like protein
MENHGFGHQADLIIAEPHTLAFSLTLHTSRKADTARRPKADARPETAPNHRRRIKTIFNHFRNRHARHNWQVHREVYSASDQVKIGLLRGYCDADGSPIFNRSRKQPLIKIESVNHDGLLDVNGTFHKLGYNSHVWRESKTRRTWALYLTRLEDVRRFHQQIRFSITRKQSRLSDVITLKTSSRTVE